MNVFLVIDSYGEPIACYNNEHEAKVHCEGYPEEDFSILIMEVFHTYYGFRHSNYNELS